MSFGANGALGIRNMGGHLEELMRWREDVANGKVLGPRIVLCGPVIDGPPPSHPDHSIVVRTAGEARQAVDFLKNQGADFVKVYDGVSREAYFALEDEARNDQMPFVGHVPNSVTAAEASDAGQKSIEHLAGILEGSSTIEAEIRKEQAKPQPKTGDFATIPKRIAARGSQVLETYNNQKAAQLFGRFVKKGTWQVPTLAANSALTFVDKDEVRNDTRLKYIPSSGKKAWNPQNNFLLKHRTADYVAFRKRLFQKELELAGALQRAGVQLMAGTDAGGIAFTFPGFSLHDELALLVQAGLMPIEALQAATRNPARFLGLEDSLGTVEKGKIADLVSLEVDPLEDIRNTRKIRAVPVGGRYLPQAELENKLARVAATAEE